MMVLSFAMVIAIVFISVACRHKIFCCAIIGVGLTRIENLPIEVNGNGQPLSDNS